MVDTQGKKWQNDYRNHWDISLGWLWITLVRDSKTKTFTIDTIFCRNYPIANVKLREAKKEAINYIQTIISDVQRDINTIKGLNK